jgi:hypothetical protein
MGKLRLGITMSLDGYVAHPDQNEENPLGIGGMELHEWHPSLARAALDGGRHELPLRQRRDRVGACPGYGRRTTSRSRR